MAAQSALGQQQAAVDTDVVCQRLMADYILRNGKIPGADIEAAIQLIASRGRRGYWHEVHKHIQESPPEGQGFSPAPNLLKILTKMLALDGTARWMEAHPEERRHSPFMWDVVMPPEVLDTVIDRAKSAERNFFESYLVAVVAAHDKRSIRFLRGVLRDTKVTPDPFGAPPDQASNQFYAAVGLANLGEPDGLAWLVESQTGGTLWKYPHVDVRSGDLRESRAQALAELTGLPERPLDEWRDWWKAQRAADRFEPIARVRLRYP